MISHTKHIRPASASSSTTSKSVSNYLEVLTPQPNEETYLYNKRHILKDTLPTRSKSSLSCYKEKVIPFSSTNHSTSSQNSLNSINIGKKSNTTLSHFHSNANSSNGGSLKKLSKEIRDLKIEEIKTRVSNYRLKNSLHDPNINNMTTLSKEPTNDTLTKISPNNKYKSYIKNTSSSSSSLINENRITKNQSSNPLKSIHSNTMTSSKIKDKEKPGKNDLFSELTPNDYEDPSLFFLEQFLLKIMDKDYKMALPLAHEVLRYDPYNSICKEYITVLQKKIEQDEKNESEKSDDDDTNGSDTSSSDSGSEEDSEEEEEEEGDHSDPDSDDSDDSDEESDSDSDNE